MFKPTKKKIVQFVLGFITVLLLASSVPFLRPLTLPVIQFPLKVLTLFGQEIKAIVFYHSNYVDNKELRKETDLLKRKLNISGELYYENKRLREILQFKEKSPYRVQAAQVIGRSPENWSSVIIIDKGSSQGIKKGFVVIDYLGLIGRVIETTPLTSKVLLINDPSVNVSAIVQRSRQEGLVSGTLGGTLFLKYLPKDSDVKVSDIIVTSGLTSLYPKGIPIGTVVEVGEDYSGLSNFAVIKPIVRLSDVEEVLIILP